MNSRQRTKTAGRLMGIQELMDYLSIGKSTATLIGKESGALKKIGRRSLYDREVIDKYVDGLGAR